PPTPEVAAVMGHYGIGLREVIVHEDDAGRVAAHAEGHAVRLVRTAARRYTAVGGPAWLGTALHFLPDSGQAHLLVAGDRTFVRRATGPAENDVFRIQPVRPVAEILRAARATPSPFGDPRSTDLVNLRQVIPRLVLDVRYATPNNFMGTPVYTRAAAFLHRDAAHALARVQRDLAADGLGLIVYDGYRPWYVTKAFWDATPPAQRGFVAPPSDGSRHNRGGAVDLGLVSLQTGQVIEMPSEYDEFTARASPQYPGGSRRARYYRALLRETMARHGFAVNPTEWWHFDYRDWPRYPVLNLSFEALDRP
ncbi:MAG TPA: M15 family metallopeptidase, partial [Rhodothermales bacterium]|nr:M15 family metallopeptidase [Rhodothermales bacterium]